MSGHRAAADQEGDRVTATPLTLALAAPRTTVPGSAGHSTTKEDE